MFTDWTGQGFFLLVVDGLLSCLNEPTSVTEETTCPALTIIAFCEASTSLKPGKHLILMATEQRNADILRLYRLLLYFPCSKFPVDLFVRACQPKFAWCPTGEVILKSPEEDAVPTWLLSVYNTNTAFFRGHSTSLLGNLIRRTQDRGIWHLERVVAFNSGVPLIERLKVEDDEAMIRDWVSVLIHAFPSHNMEIIGEEMMSRLVSFAIESVLPLLSTLSDLQLKNSVLPELQGK